MISNDFKVGDPVTCLLYGKGTVTHVESYGAYPITALFENNGVRCYTKDGKHISGQERAVLFHGHYKLTIELTVDEPPRYKWRWLVKQNKHFMITEPFETEGEAAAAWPHWIVIQRIEESKESV